MQLRVRSLLTAGCLMACLLAFPVSASAEVHHSHRGHPIRTPGYFSYYYPYDWSWDRWGWGNYWWPYYNEPYGYQPDTGKIKLEQVDKNDQVYVNGAFAGDAGHLKTMHLPAGSYSVEVKHDGKNVINERVYVTAGKTIKLTVGDKAAHH